MKPKSLKTGSLSASRNGGNLEDFIKKHEVDPKGDLDKLDAFIKRPVQETVKATRPASTQALSDD